MSLEPRALPHFHQLKVVGVEDMQVLDGELEGQQLLFIFIVHHLENNFWRERKNEHRLMAGLRASLSLRVR